MYPASHAHTLLLDLKEQLVVVANLDKIKLDSSPYSTCNASQSTSNYVSSISSPSSSTTTKTTKTTSIIVNSNSSVAGIVCKKIINSKQNHLTSTHIERNNVMNGSVDRSTYFGYTTNTFGSINTINANHNFFNKNNNKSLVLDNAYRMEFDPYFDFSKLNKSKEKKKKNAKLSQIFYQFLLFFIFFFFSWCFVFHFPINIEFKQFFILFFYLEYHLEKL